MIKINKKLNSEKNPDVVTMLRRKVEAIDGEIDRLGYGLFNFRFNEYIIININIFNLYDIIKIIFIRVFYDFKKN